MGSSSQRKGGIRTEWAKHLRPYGKRQHWKRVRRYREPDKPSRSRKKSKPWIIQKRYRFLDFDFTVTDRYAKERDMRTALRSMKHQKEGIVYSGHSDCKPAFQY